MKYFAKMSLRMKMLNIGICLSSITALNPWQITTLPAPPVPELTDPVQSLPGLAKSCPLSSVFLDQHFLERHFLERNFLGNARGKRRIRVDMRVGLVRVGARVNAGFVGVRM